MKILSKQEARRNNMKYKLLEKENNEDIQLFSNVVLPSIDFSNSGPVVLQEPVSPSLTGKIIRDTKHYCL